MRILILLLQILFCVFGCAQEENTELVYKLRASSEKSKPAPVLIILHGYGSNEEDLFELANTIDSRYTIFSLRAPIPLGNSGFAWYRLNRDEKNNLIYDYREVVNSRIQVMRFIREQCRTHHLDSSRIVLMGFSQGAMLAYDLALAHPGKIYSVMALSGRLMEESKPKPTGKMVPITNFFIAHGSQDELIPVSEAEKARDYLKQIQAKEVEYRVYPMQHVLNGQEITDLRNQLKKWLEPKAVVEKKSNTQKK